MTELEYTTSGTAMAQTKTINEYEKVQTRNSSVQGGHGDRGNARNDTRDSAASTNKYYKETIGAFRAMIALKYEKVELNKSFDVFRGKVFKYTIRELKNDKDVLVLVQDMEDPKDSFDTKNKPKDLNETEDGY